MKIKAIIFIEDMYKCNIEPNRGEQIFRFNSKSSREQFSTAIGNFVSVSSSVYIENRGKYYGNPSKDLKSKYNVKSRDLNDKQYYNKLFYASNKKYDTLFIENCFIIREIEL